MSTGSISVAPSKPGLTSGDLHQHGPLVGSGQTPLKLLRRKVEGAKGAKIVYQGGPRCVPSKPNLMAPVQQHASRSMAPGGGASVEGVGGPTLPQLSEALPKSKKFCIGNRILDTSLPQLGVG